MAAYRSLAFSPLERGARYPGLLDCSVEYALSQQEMDGCRSLSTRVLHLDAYSVG